MYNLIAIISCLVALPRRPEWNKELNALCVIILTHCNNIGSCDYHLLYISLTCGCLLVANSNTVTCIHGNKMPICVLTTCQIPHGSNNCIITIARLSCDFVALLETLLCGVICSVEVRITAHTHKHNLTLPIVLWF